MENVVEETQVGNSALRDYLADTFNIPSHRGTEEFALEVLRTLAANLKYHQTRTVALIHSTEIQKAVAKAQDELERLSRVASDLIRMEAAGADVQPGSTSCH
jgi:hypothetical protein